jgi:hypothetical protein
LIDRKTVLELLARSLLYSLIVVLVDFILFFFLNKGLNGITDSLSFIILLEGGICLTAGGATVFYSPIGAKIGEVIFHSKPWNTKRLKDVEKKAQAWIATGIILVFEALLLSAL